MGDSPCWDIFCVTQKAIYTARRSAAVLLPAPFHAEPCSSWRGAAKERVLYGFAGGTDGANPYGGLVADAEDNLYGTTNQGGASSYGTVFKLDKTGHETLLHTFTGTGGDGTFPYDGLVRDAKGNLYGTARGGGSNGCYQGSGCGIVFMQTP